MNMGLFLLISFLVIAFIGIPIALALAMTSVVYYFITNNVFYAQMMAPSMFAGMNNFELLAIPLFIIAGDLLFAGKVSKTLVDLANSIVGSVKGSLAIVTTLACMFFGAVSGSGPATAAAIGSVVAPEMDKEGYDNTYTACVISASGPLGVLIPPSILMVVYGCTTSTSIGSLLLAGVYPGILYGIILAVYEYYSSKKKGYGGNGMPFTWKRFIIALKNAFWALLTPVIILGGIYSGLFTPTEAAGVTVIYALIVGMVVYKSISFKELPKLLLQSGVTTATVLIIIGCVSCFAWVLSRERIPQMLAAAAIANLKTPVAFLLMTNAIMLFAGMIENGSSAILLLAPLLHPIALQFGIDPVFYGAMCVANLAIGMITPPVAPTLYVACRVCKAPMAKLIPGIMPFFAVMCVGLVIVMLTPGAVTFLPNLLLK